MPHCRERWRVERPLSRSERLKAARQLSASLARSKNWAEEGRNVFSCRERSFDTGLPTALIGDRFRPLAAGDGGEPVGLRRQAGQEQTTSLSAGLCATGVHRPPIVPPR